MENKDVVWVDVETLSKGFDEFRMEQATELCGREITLFYKGGYSVSYKFIDIDTLSATYVCSDKKECVASKYTAAKLRENIFYVDFIWSCGNAKSVSTVIDFDKNIATTVIGILPTAEEASISAYNRYRKNMPMTSVKAIWDHASVDCPFADTTQVHQTTNKLIGERIQFVYSENDAYEHIYLSENYYTWHCIKGVEAGLADTEKCYYYDLGDDLIWFVWIEKAVPTVGSVCEDFKKMRSFGKLYGYKNSIDDQTVINTPVGSYATMLNKTTYKL